MLALSSANLQAKFNHQTCLKQARSEMEQLYCKIRQKGKGGHLPPLHEFRHNTFEIQTLLLKRLAVDINLEIPEIHTPSSDHQDNPDDEHNVPHSTAAEITENPPLANCQLEIDTIICPEASFEKILNQTNASLSEDAFSPQNQLELPVFSGKFSGKLSGNQSSNDPESTQAVFDYLANAYRLYIEKMLTIGLGQSTMTYTKFHHTFQHTLNNNLDFSHRFKTMYQMLKLEKQQLNAGKTDHAPFTAESIHGIEDCAPLSSSLLVCDNGAQNWLFMKNNNP